MLTEIFTISQGSCHISNNNTVSTIYHDYSKDSLNIDLKSCKRYI